VGGVNLRVRDVRSVTNAVCKGYATRISVVHSNEGEREGSMGFRGWNGELGKKHDERRKVSNTETTPGVKEGKPPQDQLKGK